MFNTSYVKHVYLKYGYIRIIKRVFPRKICTIILEIIKIVKLVMMSRFMDYLIEYWVLSIGYSLHCDKVTTNKKMSKSKTITTFMSWIKIKRIIASIDSTLTKNIFKERTWRAKAEVEIIYNENEGHWVLKQYVWNAGPRIMMWKINDNDDDDDKNQTPREYLCWSYINSLLTGRYNSLFFTFIHRRPIQ